MSLLNVNLSRFIWINDQSVYCYDVYIFYIFIFLYFFIKCMQSMTMTLFKRCVYAKLHVI